MVKLCRPATRTELQMHKIGRKHLPDFTFELCSRGKTTSFLSHWDAFLPRPFPLFALKPAQTSQAWTGRRPTTGWRWFCPDNLWSGGGAGGGQELRSGSCYRWSIGGVNTCGNFLMRGRQQLKDSHGRWVRDSRPLVIPYYQWRMWGGWGVSSG